MKPAIEFTIRFSPFSFPRLPPAAQPSMNSASPSPEAARFCGSAVNSRLKANWPRAKARGVAEDVGMSVLRSHLQAVLAGRVEQDVVKRVVKRVVGVGPETARADLRISLRREAREAVMLEEAKLVWGCP